MTVDKLAMNAWAVLSVRAGSSLTIRPGPWGSWTYLAFAGRLKATAWLGSVSTHAPSGFGGGRITVDQSLEIEDAELREERAREVPCPAWARPRAQLDVVLGPQDRYFSKETRERLVSQPFALTEGFDRMGVRLSGPPLTPDAALDTRRLQQSFRIKSLASCSIGAEVRSHSGVWRLKPPFRSSACDGSPSKRFWRV